MHGKVGIGENVSSKLATWYRIQLADLGMHAGGCCFTSLDCLTDFCRLVSIATVQIMPFVYLVSSFNDIAATFYNLQTFLLRKP